MRFLAGSGVALRFLVAPLLVAAGCGAESTSGQSIDSYFPGDNDVGTWVEDLTVGAPGVEIANTPAAAEAIIDGDAEPFTAHDFKIFARQHYTSGAYKLELRVWDMGTSAGARTLYDDLMSNDVYMSNQWQSLAVGDEGRITDTGASFWVNSIQGPYYVETKVNQVVANDPDSRAGAEEVARAVIAKMP